ncbi:hypothetical protein [Paenibacillus chitinolyticus]|uniref:hypothetical protein n=1 Tax=Paenibacillus chitinolyticus TaxID=79263 RepID=UPI00295E3AE4|nr:hypothetical protein [Paenibacillus chitinolyticus]
MNKNVKLRLVICRRSGWESVYAILEVQTGAKDAASFTPLNLGYNVFVLIVSLFMPLNMTLRLVCPFITPIKKILIPPEMSVGEKDP